MTEREISWSSLVEGDRLKSIKTGKFYEVERVYQERHPGRAGQYRIKLAGIDKVVFRPTEAEPTAIVQRGATGNAVDVWIEVLSSGGK
jgi:hypothetical protein